MKPVRRDSLGLLALSALAASCGDELDPAWKVKSFRVFGVRIENATRAASDPRSAEAAPGESVRLSLSQLDPSTPARPLQVIWLFCAQTRRTGNNLGCDPASASILRGGAEQTFVVPSRAYGVDPFGRARLQGIAVVCAGGAVGIDPTTLQPTCTGVGAESVVLTRSLIVRTTEGDPINHNPALLEVVLYRNGDLNAPVTLGPDGGARVPRCTTDPCPDHTIELRVSPQSREMYRTLDNFGAPVVRPERLQFGFFTTNGVMDLSFYVDSATRPDGPVRNKWKAPGMPGTVTFVFSAQDQRGGFDWVQRSVTVE